MREIYLFEDPRNQAMAIAREQAIEKFMFVMIMAEAAAPPSGGKEGDRFLNHADPLKITR